MKAIIMSPPCNHCGRQWKGQKSFACYTMVLEDDSQITGCTDCITEFGKIVEQYKPKEVPTEVFNTFWGIKESEQ